MPLSTTFYLPTTRNDAVLWTLGRLSGAIPTQRIDNLQRFPRGIFISTVEGAPVRSRVTRMPRAGPSAASGQRLTRCAGT
jgi:hypothetical protein